MEKLQLYYHFPFCLSKCAYCSFFSRAGVNDETIARYTDAVISQTKGFDARGYEICSVYLGGGTPTVAGAGRLAAILDCAHGSFKFSRDAEITVEANPKTVDLDGLSLLKSAGVNRLSIGAQSFNDDTLRLLNRPHTAKDFVRCFDLARKAGFDNISADLIFALPGENAERLMHSVRSLISLAPEHISVYGLTVEEGTPLWDKKESLSFPDEDEEERQYFLLCEELSKAGYGHYEISNYAKPGFESRHNIGYWKRTPYFGFGAGAHSFYKSRRFFTSCDIEAYIDNVRRVKALSAAFAEAKVIDDAEAEEERIMLGLRLSEGIALDRRVPRRLIDEGLVAYKDGRVRITEKGFRVSNSIISQLI